ncbi:hypothetical protein U1Q18_038416 [Sarracenia purpurea var. burkii]
MSKIQEMNRDKEENVRISEQEKFVDVLPSGFAVDQGRGFKLCMTNHYVPSAVLGFCAADLFADMLLSVADFL